MSTNYYAKFTDKNIVLKYFEGEFDINEENDHKEYYVHIGKRSNGWKPLFESHPKAYSSVQEMISFFKKHLSDVVIEDEYGKAYSLDSLKKELIDWNKDVEPHKVFYSNYVGWVTVPIDNTLYAKKSTDPYERMYCNHHFDDSEGYNFLEGDFA